MQVFQHPWFKTDLPKGMDGLNFELVQRMSVPGMQSVEEIERVVHQAQHTQASLKGDHASSQEGCDYLCWMTAAAGACMLLQLLWR